MAKADFNDLFGNHDSDSEDDNKAIIKFFEEKDDSDLKEEVETELMTRAELTKYNLLQFQKKTEEAKRKLRLKREEKLKKKKKEKRVFDKKKARTAEELEIADRKLEFQHLKSQGLIPRVTRPNPIAVQRAEDKAARAARKEKHRSDVAITTYNRQRKHAEKKLRQEARREAEQRSISNMQLVSESGLTEGRILLDTRRHWTVESGHEEEIKESSIDLDFLESSDHRLLTGLCFEQIYETLRSLDESFKSVIHILDPVINFCICLRQCATARSKADVLSAVYIYTRLVCANHHSLDRAVLIALVNTMISDILSRFLRMFKSEPCTIDTESLSEALRTGSNALYLFIDSDIVRAIRMWVIRLASFHWFSKDASDRIYLILGAPEKRQSLIELSHHLIRDVINVVKLGENVCDGKPLSECLFLTDPIASAIHKARSILVFKNSLYNGLPVPGYMDENEFLIEASQLIDFFVETKKKSSPMRSNHIELAQLELELSTSVNSIICKRNGSRRATPMGIMIHGEPGVGKSKLVTAVAQVYSRVCGRKYADSHMFHKNPSQEYWEGYNSFQHPYVHMAEVGGLNRNLARTQGDPNVLEITALLDSLPYAVNMAFGDKGKMFFAADLLIIDTNNPTCNADVILSNYAAFQRRFIHIEVQVKPEYRKEVGGGMDATKAFNAPGPELDRWKFGVSRYVPIDKVKCQESRLISIVGGNNEIYDLVKLLEKEFRQHIEVETKLLKSYGDALSIEAVYDRIYQDDPEFKENYYPACPVELDEINDCIPPVLLPLIDEEEKIFSESGFWDKVKPSFTEFMCSYVSKDHIVDPRAIVEINRLYLNQDKLTENQRLRFERLMLLFIGIPKGSSTQGICEGLQKELDIRSGMMQNQIVNQVQAPKPVTFVARLGRVVSSVITRASAVCHNPVIETVRVTAWKVICILLLASALFTFELGIITYKYATRDTTSFKARTLTGCAIGIRSILRGYMRDLKVYTGVVELAEGFYSTMWNEHKDSLMMLLGVVGAALTTYKIYARLRPSKTEVIKNEPDNFKSEARADHHFNPEIINRSVTDLEERMNCSKSFEKIPIKSMQIWNTRELPIPPVYTSEPESLYNHIAHNIWEVRVRYNDDAPSRTHILGLCKNFALINYHALDFTKGYCTIEVPGVKDDIDSDPRSTIIQQEQVSKCGNDYAIIRLSQITFYDITKFIDDSSVQKGGSARLGATIVHAHYIPDNIVINDRKHKVEITLSSYFMYTLAGHRPGICGLPLIMSRGKGSVIVGIHTGGDQASLKCVATIIKRSRIESAMQILTQRDPTKVMFAQSAVERLQFGPTPRKSWMNYEKAQCIRYFGKVPGKVMANQTSKIIKSAIAPDVERILAPIGKRTKKFDKPLLGPKWIEGEYVSPYNNALNDICSVKKALRPDILKKVEDLLVERIITMLADRGVKKIEPLTLKCAINGPELDPFIRSMNISTSAGFGWGCKKNKIIKVDEDNVKYATPELVEEVMRAVSCYDKGERAAFVFSGCLKDETRSEIKVKQGKTRLFNVGPTEEIVLSRMVLAPFYALMVQHGDIFGTAIGINVYMDADRVRKNLESFNPDVVMEGDYKAYDSSMPFDIGVTWNSVVHRVCARLGYNQEALNILHGIACDHMFPRLEVLKEVFEAAGHQPSGMYGTAENNSGRGIVMLMYAWYVHDVLSEMDFWAYVLPYTYGDDVKAAVRRAVMQHYNNVYYARICKEHFGMDYTAADKSDKIAPFVPLDESTFLKRKDRFHPILNRYVACLDLDSIYRALEWVNPSPHLDTADQTIACVQSMLYEVYFYCDEEQMFNGIRNELVNSISNRLSITPAEVSEVLPTFRQLTERLSGDEKPSQQDDCKAYNEQFYYTESDNEQPACSVDCVSIVGGERPLCNHVKYASRKHGLGLSCPGLVNLELTQLVKLREKLLLEKEFEEKESITGIELLDNKNVHELRNMHLSNRQIRLSQGRMQRMNALARVDEIEETIRFIDRVRSKKETIRLFTESCDDDDYPYDSADELMFKMDSFVTESATEYEMSSGVIDMSHLSTLENVHDVSGSELEVKSAGYAVSIDAGSVDYLDMSDFLSRPVPIDQFQVPLLTDVDVEYDIWDDYTLVPSVRAKLRNYSFLKGQLHVKITLSGTPFHYGRFLVSYQPWAVQNDPLTNLVAQYALDPFMRPLLLNYLSQAPGSVVMDVRANQPVELVLPFIHPKPMARLFNGSATALGSATSISDVASMGRLYIYSINELKCVTATPSDASFYVYAWMTDVELGTSTGSHMVITTESADEREIGVVEKTASRVSTFFSQFAKVPMLQPYATASSMIATGIASFAAIFGWSKPIMIGAPSWVKNLPLQNGALVTGYDTNFRLVLDPKQELSIDPRICGVDTDDMTIQSIASRQSYLTTFSWNDDSSIMGPSLWQCAINPSLYTINSSTYQPTALAFATAPFYWWRGDITFKFEIVCSQFHRGKLLVYFEPNIAQSVIIDASISMNKQYLFIIDLQETQDFEVCVNWSCAWPWLMAGGASATHYGTSFSPTSKTRIANGYIGVTPLTSLQSPDDSDISINVYVKSEDMHVNQLLDSSATNYSRTLITESGDENALYDITCVELNPSSAKLDHISELMFGEEPLSFRTLLKRYVTTGSQTIASNATTEKVLRTVFPIFPTDQSPYSASSAATTNRNLFDYLRYAYLGYKGGIRKRSYLWGVRADNAHLTSKVAMIGPSTSPATSIAWATTPEPAYLIGSATYMPHTNSGIEFELPFYSNNLFVYAFNENLYGNVNTDYIMNDTWSKSYRISTDILGSTPDLYVTEESAAADDFSFMRFQGAPFITYP